MGARRMAELFERFGRETLEACFQAILDTAANLPPRVPAEDQGRRLSLRGLYRARRRRRAALHARAHDDQDARQDPARLHRHRSGSQGADQLGARRGRGRLSQMARADAALARRHAGTGRRDRLQRRRLDVIEVVSAKGTLITPHFRRRPCALFLMLRSLGLLAGVVARPRRRHAGRP